MKALYKPAPGPGLALTEAREPEPGDNDVMIRVVRTGICGTDLHIEQWDPWAARTIKPPLIPGHEFSGEVVAVGRDVDAVPLGAFVSAEGHVVCGLCRNCRAGRRHLCTSTSGIGVNRPGAFAEYVTVPAGNVWQHPAGMDPDLAALFDPLGNAVHTALSFSVVGEDVLITGAGPIGLMAAAVARHVGARYIAITDVNDRRLELARRFGVDVTINVTRERIVDAQRRLGLLEGFDVGFEMSGQGPALREMIDNMNHGGHIAMLGLPTDDIAIDWASVVTRMITIKGIYGREMFETWYAANAMVQSGLDVTPIVTNRFAAGDWSEAFSAARSQDSGKVVIDWT